MHTTTLALHVAAACHRKARHAGDSWQLVTVEKGQTLGALFESLDIPASTMHQFSNNPKPARP